MDERMSTGNYFMTVNSSYNIATLCFSPAIPIDGHGNNDNWVYIHEKQKHLL